MKLLIAGSGGVGESAADVDVLRSFPPVEEAGA